MKHTSTSFVAILALIVSVVSSIPPFLSLNKSAADVYFSQVESGIQIPDSMDKNKVRKILSDNKIPTDTVKFQLINQGNAEAKEVKVSFEVDGKMLSAEFQPSYKSKPIWVNLPDLDISSNPELLQFSVVDLAISQVLDFEVAYERNAQGTPDIQVFSNGRAATSVSNIYQVEPWSRFQVFQTPLIILGIGLGLVILWAIGIVIYNNEQLRKSLAELGLNIIKEVANGVIPFFRF